MFNDFRKFSKKNNLRGWRLINHENQVYLQKYCDKYNLEEYRFFLKQFDGRHFSLTYGVRIKADAQCVSINKKNTYLAKAKEICDLMNHEVSDRSQLIYS